MNIQVVQKQARIPVTVIQVEGNIDSVTYNQFETQAKQAIQTGTKDMLVDLSHVPYMSSAGIRALITLFKQLHDEKEVQAAQQAVLSTNFKSPHLKLAGVTPHVLEVLKMAGIDEFLDIYKTSKDALAAF